MRCYETALRCHVSTDEGTDADVDIFNGKTVKGPCVELPKISIMQLEAQLRLCQSCFWCCKSGLRLFSQSYTQRKAATYYDLLGVKSDATLEEIKNAFFDKSKKLHPDSDPSNPALHSQFVQLNEAYRVLSKDLSRKEYDFKIQQPYAGAQVFRSASTDPSYRGSMDAYENIRYWEQVHHPHTPEMMAEEKQKRRKRNFRLVAYCVVAMMLSIGAHAVLFKKLEEVHTNFMDEKDRIIIEIYNEAKERARVNGFKKQTEILRQKHAEFKEKYKRTDVGDDK
ncbi:dnaJ homolog subfamily C member 4 isoform X1 [Simochromis diagramma]|uniref:dnaJ homolog subfamily C member 4 isoform X1 n=2 Tax=Simochromis diagramma TaxID=43689 RepID=UPI001A7ED44E|nr:dnaJ homolog subfamily C member 4 isoform X1 [Simochromis diagramma]